MMVRPAKTVRQVLLAMRWMLVNRGWTQGYYEDNGCYCLVGALRSVVMDEDSRAYEIRQRALVLLGGALPVSQNLALGDLLVWNDEKRRRKSQVIALIDRALKAA
jgi:hypothetical protein